jgi:hypothetical protein
MSWACVGLVSLLAAIDADCQALIEANTQAIGLVRTIQVHYTIASTGRGKKQSTEIWWAREGTRERIRRVGGHIEPTADGRPRDIEDILIDGPVYKWLSNWDPKRPQKITPTKQGTVRAWTGPQTNVNKATITPSQQLHFEVDFLPRRTLRELANVSTQVTCQRSVQVDGRELSLISLECPEDSGTLGKRHVDVYLDPAAGYMMRKVVVNAPSVRIGKGPPMSISDVREVLEFEDFGNGVFVPTRIRLGSLKHWGAELKVTSLKVNEPIPPDTFELRWPKFAEVSHTPPVNGRYRVEIWGDDKPIAEVKTRQDIKSLEAELRRNPLLAAELGPIPGAPLPPPASLMAKLSIALGTLVAIMVGLILYRRIREQAAA